MRAVYYLAFYNDDNVESLNFWLTKFVEEVVKLNGERLNIFRRALDTEMRQATQQGVGMKSKMEERKEITEGDEATFWKLGLMGCQSARSLLTTIYFYNGKLFGLRSQFCYNFRIDFESVTYDESLSKTYHGGLKDLKYKPRVVKHVFCASKAVNHQPCIVNCYATYMEKVEEKLIRDRTGHHSNALLKYEKSSLLQQMIVSKLLGPPVANIKESATVTTTTSTKAKEGNPAEIDSSAESESNDLMSIEPFDFGIEDELLANIVLPEISNVKSGSVFNNCTFHFNK
ncbi:hypothetical protein AC249_AIPGENE87 [Exaiptasia diaphana]|nr:hypothetical protein AC249_AIPGENE87 [Exaiptasia diaphana]